MTFVHDRASGRGWRNIHYPPRVRHPGCPGQLRLVLGNGLGLLVLLTYPTGVPGLNDDASLILAFWGRLQRGCERFASILV